MKRILCTGAIFVVIAIRFTTEGKHSMIQQKPNNNKTLLDIRKKARQDSNNSTNFAIEHRNKNMHQELPGNSTTSNKTTRLQPSMNLKNLASQQKSKIIHKELSGNGTVLNKTSKTSTTFMPTPGHCRNQTFCEHVAQYPKEHILRQLRMKNRARTVNKFLRTETKSRLENTRRDYWRALCETSTSVIRPKVAKSKDHKWMYILNLEDRDAHQEFQIETCRQFGECNIRDQFPLGYLFRCKQTYIHNRMAAIDHTGKPVLDYFQLPTSCTCTFKYNIRSDKRAPTTPISRRKPTDKISDRKENQAFKEKNQKRKNKTP